MKAKEIKNKIEELVSSGDTNSAISFALENLTNRNVRKELIQLSNRLILLKKEEREGIISDEKKRLELNKINSSLLNAISEIEEIDSHKKPQNLNKTLIILGFATLAVLLSYTFFNGKDTIRDNLNKKENTASKIDSNSLIDIEAREKQKNIDATEPNKNKQNENTSWDSQTSKKNKATETNIQSYTLNLIVNSDFSDSRVFVDGKEVAFSSSNLVVKQIELPTLNIEYEIELINNNGKTCFKKVRLTKTNQKLFVCD